MENRINVLDLGFVELASSWGDDLRPANIARNSFGSGFDSKYSDAQNIALDDYLIRHHHSSPLEFNEVILLMKLPIFVARQLVRHRTQVINEISLRYVEASREFYLPAIERMQRQSEDNKQGSSPALIDYPEEARALIYNSCNKSFDNYEALIKMGLNKETARSILPLSTYTTWYCKYNLHNLFHMLKLRMHPHAQYETRMYAVAVYQLVKERYPYLTASWENHVLNALTLSADEVGCMEFYLDNEVVTENLPKSRQKELKDKLGDLV